MKRKQGFSLLELILVLGIASAVSFMKFQDLKQEQESVQARAAGEQIKQIGEAVNGYINIRYNKLSTLTAATGTGTDPGPRTCSGSVCTITYQTLINEGLLPVSFTGVNVNKSAYTILLKRNGTAPNYVINGLITTNNSWVEGSKIRYDLLGKAMQTAGIDSGMTKTASTVSGYSGSWSADATDYTNINKTGILGYRVGYDSSMYSVYLRRDGTLPMTGVLNMGGNNINNAKNITASGTITSGILKSTGDTDVGANLIVAGSSKLNGATTVSNNLTIIGNGQVNGTLTSNSRITGNDIYSNTEMYTTNWFRTLGDGGIYFQKYGGGFYMTDTATIVAYGGKNISTSGSISAGGNITASGRLSTGEFLQINGIATVGGSCSSNGLQGRTSAGQLLSCVDGVWRASFINGNNENGYWTKDIETGLIKQWGKTNATGSKSFPVSFTNENSITLNVSNCSDMGARIDAAYGKITSASGFYTRTRQSTNDYGYTSYYVCWSAVGY